MASPVAADSREPSARFAVLGPVCVQSADGSAIRVHPPLHRRVLATLLLSAGARRPGPWLAQAVWGDCPPRDPAGSLRTAVCGLRRCLGESLASRMESPDDGHSYMFRAAPAEVDVLRFDELAAQGRAAWYARDPRKAAALLAAAAGLWRDPALRDVPDTPLLADLRGALIRGRADVEDLLMDARLELGEHHEAIGELRETLGRDPHREHVWAQLMLALDRDGRPAEAMLAFAEARAALRAELGSEPGPWLTAVYQQIAGDRDRPRPSPADSPAGTLAPASFAQPWPASARSWPS